MWKKCEAQLHLLCTGLNEIKSSIKNESEIAKLTKLGDQVENLIINGRTMSMFYEAIEISLTGIIIVNADSKIIYTNNTFNKTFGYQQEELMNADLIKIMPSKYRTMHKRGMKVHMETNQSNLIGKTIQLEGLKSCGKIFPIRLRINKLQQENDNFYIASVSDITQTIENESKIKEQENFINEIQNVAGFSSWKFNINTEEFFDASKILYLLGIEKTTLNLSMFNTFMQNPDIQIFKSNLEKIQNGEKSVMFEIKVRNTRNEIVYLRVFMKAKNDTHEKVTILHGAFVDVSYEKAEQKKYLDAIVLGQNQERERLSKDLHDGLGQILTGLQLHLSLLKSSIPVEHFDNIFGLSTDAMKEYRAVSHNLSPPALNEKGLFYAIHLLCGRINFDNQDIISFVNVNHTKHIDILDTIPTSVQTEMYRITQELVTNAMKHGKSSKIEITMDFHNKFIITQVKDNGVGIDCDKLETNNHKGLGLNGILNRILLLGGNFDISSSPNNGTVCTIILY
ncbi:MAG: PAS domain S-box protein, partial [Flavobacteriaceae bacterium]|nr:PAS domain S-box protein [Flavobacteriaceae bacterium]